MGRGGEATALFALGYRFSAIAGDFFSRKRKLFSKHDIPYQVNTLQKDFQSPFEADLRQAQVPVLGYLVRLTGNLADARDLLQLTNLTAWEKRNTFEQGTSAVAWSVWPGRSWARR